MDLVSHTLQVKAMARSCREDTFKFEEALNFTEELKLSVELERDFDESERGLKLEASWVFTSLSSLGSGNVCILLVHISAWLRKEFAEARNCHDRPASNRFNHQIGNK